MRNRRLFQLFKLLKNTTKDTIKVYFVKHSVLDLLLRFGAIKAFRERKDYIELKVKEINKTEEELEEFSKEFKL